MTPNKFFKSAVSLLIFVAQFTSQASSETQFLSHVRVQTPSISFTHGVGNPIKLPVSHIYDKLYSFRSFRIAPPDRGYVREVPVVPFNDEDVESYGVLPTVNPWHVKRVRSNSNKFYKQSQSLGSTADLSSASKIIVLPPSPYKVDSPDPESLWPPSLLQPSLVLPPFAADISQGTGLSPAVDKPDDMENVAPDPYLLNEEEAEVAIERAQDHGPYYFAEIPHIESLAANQNLRIMNNLQPHRLGSIRYMWSYNRP